MMKMSYYYNITKKWFFDVDDAKQAPFMGGYCLFRTLYLIRLHFFVSWNIESKQNSLTAGVAVWLVN